MVSIDSLPKAPEVLELVDTIEIQNVSTWKIIGDMLIATSSKGAHFIDISNPEGTEEISSIKLRTDAVGYINSPIGIYNNFAFFQIACDGVEIVDITDILNPVSYGFLNNSCSLNHIDGNLGISRWGIFDITDVSNFREVLRFEYPEDRPLIVGRHIFFLSGRHVRAIDMDAPGTTQYVYCFDQEIKRAAWVKEDIYIAWSEDTVFIIKLLTKAPYVEVLSSITHEAPLNNVWPTTNGYLATHTPLLRQSIDMVTLADPSAPRRIHTLEAGAVIDIQVGSGYFVCNYLKDRHTKEQSGTPTTLVIRHNDTGPLQLIAEILDSGYVCRGDYIYRGTGAGIDIYRVGLPDGRTSRPELYV